MSRETSLYPDFDRFGLYSVPTMIYFTDHMDDRTIALALMGAGPRATKNFRASIGTERWDAVERFFRQFQGVSEEEIMEAQKSLVGVRVMLQKQAN